MTSRSLEPARSAPIEKIGLPGQPEAKANGRSNPEDELDVAQLRTHADELGFSPQDQVRWLAPAQLLRTAVQAGLASAFSTFTDKRELQRTFPADPLALAPDEDGGCWIDYMADTGDGFDSTYTVASLLAAESLLVSGPDGEQHQLPRGRLLVLGGDEVYPTASSERYEDRLKGPMRTALHGSDVRRALDGDESGGGTPPPLLLALPGNHDWYDGLTAFLRVFGQRRRIGGWQTVQGRSYFVMQLPGGWWLAGLDSQLGSEIDDPQLDFFRAQLTERLQPGDGVILCCASPTWTRTPNDARAFDSYHYFERTVVNEVTDPVTGRTRPTGAQVRLWISGDDHHYARYVETSDPHAPDRLDLDHAAPGRPRQLITSGQGGAFLSATHYLPDALMLPPAGSTERHHGQPAGYRLAERWPTEADSRRLMWGSLALSARGLPFRNPGFWRLVGAGHVALFLLLISLLGVIRQQGPIDAVRATNLAQVARLGGQIALWWVVITAAMTIVFSVRARRIRGPGIIVVGVGLQILIALLGLAVAVWLVRVVALPGWFPGGRALPNYLLLAVLLVVVAPVVGLIGSYGVGLTLALGRSGVFITWQFSAQSIDDRKGFVRLRIDPEGRLLVYPVVVDTVVRRWRIGAGSPTDKPPRRVTAVDGLPAAHLVEAPVVIHRSPTAS